MLFLFSFKKTLVETRGAIDIAVALSRNMLSVAKVRGYVESQQLINVHMQHDHEAIAVSRVLNISASNRNYGE